MNWLWILSGLLAAVTVTVHLFAGGRDVARPLLNSPLTQEIRLTIYACWHLLSVPSALSALALLVAGLGLLGAAGGALVLFVSVLWLLFGGVFLAVTLGMARPRDLLRFPQWGLLVPVGVLGIWGFA